MIERASEVLAEAEAAQVRISAGIEAEDREAVWTGARALIDNALSLAAMTAFMQGEANDGRMQEFRRELGLMPQLDTRVDAALQSDDLDALCKLCEQLAALAMGTALATGTLGEAVLA